MKLAFIVHRTNYLKHYGPLVQAACARGWDSELWLLPERGAKTYLAPHPEDIPELCERGQAVHQLQNLDEMPALYRDSAPDAIVSLHPKAFYPLPEDAFFVSLQHNVDSFFEATAEELRSSDLYFFKSRYWLEFGGEYYQATNGMDPDEFRQSMQATAVLAGTPQHDIFAQIDQAAVRQRWGIPIGQPMVLYYPLNLGYWPGAWPFFFRAENRGAMVKALLKGLGQEGLGFFFRYLPWALAGWNELALTRSIRVFCDRNQAVLVVKARRKDPLRPDVEALADLALYDEDIYPATSHQLQAAADLCIHAYSTAAMEAAAAGAYGLCIDRPNIDQPLHTLWRRSDVGSAFNYPGVIDFQTIPWMVRNFAAQHLDAYRLEAQARADYLATYAGEPDAPASDMILDSIAARIGTQHNQPLRQSA